VLAGPRAQILLISPIHSETVKSLGFWLTTGPESRGNPTANCPEQISESTASDRQVLLLDEPTYV